MRAALKYQLISLFAVLAVAAPSLAAPAVAAEPNPLEGIGGRLVYIDASGSLVVLDGASGERRTLIKGNTSRTIWSPTWSPDGKWIAFVAHPNTNTKPREDDIYVMRADGGSPARRITEHENFMHSLSWFPNSEVLLYGTGFNGYFNVNRVNIDGNHQRIVYGVGMGENSPSHTDGMVSPDGQYIASTSISYDQASQRVGIYVSAADGSGGGIIATAENEGRYPSVSWMPDSSGIVFARDSAVVRAPVGGGAPHTLVRATGQIAGSPIVSPSASHVAFTYDGGEVLGERGPVTEWRLSVRSLSDGSGRYWTGVDPYSKMQWLGNGRGILYLFGGITGPQTLRILDLDSGSSRTVSSYSTAYSGGYDWHA